MRLRGLEPPQPVDQLLDAADGERRDDQLAAALSGLGDDLGQASPRRRPARARDRRRSTRPAGSPPRPPSSGSGSTGLPKRPRSPPKRMVLPSTRMRDVGGSEQMSGVDELDLDPCRDRKRTVVADRLQLRHARAGVDLACRAAAPARACRSRAGWRRRRPLPGAVRRPAARCDRDPGCRPCRRRGRGIPAPRGAAGSRSDRGARASGRSRRCRTP